MRYWMAGLLLLGTLAPTGLVWADCQAQGQQAAGMLMAFKQDALNNQPVNKDQFKAEFEPLVYKMKQGGCMRELMGLMNIIQSEQQQYAAPAKTAQAR